MLNLTELRRLKEPLVIVAGVPLTDVQVWEVKDRVTMQMEVVAFHSVGCTLCTFFYLALFCWATPRVRRSLIAILLGIAVVANIVTAALLSTANWITLGINSSPRELTLKPKLWTAIYAIAAWVAILCNATFIPRLFLFYPRANRKDFRRGLLLTIFPAILLIPRVIQSGIGAWAIGSSPRKTDILNKAQAAGFFCTFAFESYSTVILCYKLRKVGWARRKKSRNQPLDKMVNVVRWTFFIQVASFAVPAGIELALFTLSVRNESWLAPRIWLLNLHMYTVVIGTNFACFWPVIQADRIRSGRACDSNKFVFKFDADIDHDLKDGVTRIDSAAAKPSIEQLHILRKRELLHGLGNFQGRELISPVRAGIVTAPGRPLQAPSASAGKAPSFSSALPSPTSDSSVELSRPLPVDGTPPRSARALHSDLFVDVRCMKSDSRPTTQDSANGRHDWPRAASSIAHGDKHTTLSHDRPNCSGNRLDQIIVPSAAHAPWPPASASSPAHDNRGSRRFRQHMYRRSLFSRTNSSLSPPSVRDPILTPTRLSEVTEVPHESGTLRSVRASAETINAALSNVQATELCAQSRRRSDEISRQWSRSDISDGQINSASALAGYERHFSPSGQGYTQRSEAMSYGPLTRQFSGRSFACSGISAGSSDHCGIDHGPSGIADVGRCESFTGRSVPVSRARAQLDGCAFDVRADHLRHHHSHQHSASFLTHEADLVNAEVRRPSRSLPHLKRSSRPDPLLTANVEWRDPSSEHLQEGVEHYEYYHRHNRRDAGQHSCQRSKSADFERARKGSLDAIRIETEVRVDVS